MDDDVVENETEIRPDDVVVFDAVRLFETVETPLSVGLEETLEDDDTDIVIVAVAEAEEMLENEASDEREPVPEFVAVTTADGVAVNDCGLTV